jgi:hypothetical protein
MIGVFLRNDNNVMTMVSSTTNPQGFTTIFKLAPSNYDVELECKMGLGQNETPLHNTFAPIELGQPSFHFQQRQFLTNVKEDKIKAMVLNLSIFKIKLLTLHDMFNYTIYFFK